MEFLNSLQGSYVEASQLYRLQKWSIYHSLHSQEIGLTWKLNATDTDECDKQY